MCFHCDLLYDANWVYICRHESAASENVTTHHMTPQVLLFYSRVLLIWVVLSCIWDQTGSDKTVQASINRQHVADGNFLALYRLSHLLAKNKPCLHNNKLPALLVAHFAQMLLTTANGHAGSETRKGWVKMWERKRATHKQSSTAAGPLSFHCVPHQMAIHGASGCREAGERHPPTQSRGLCCVAHREQREG